ncbi:MAG: peptide chain release factor N(5)-glutamine methyltransferase [Chloroflexota bacterium]
MNAGEAVAAAARRLAGAGSASARLDAQLLLRHVTGWSQAELLAHPERRLAPGVLDNFKALVERRLELEPIAYLVGEREFYGRTFRVDARVLIPRPETEILVDIGRAAVSRFRSLGVVGELRVVDVGTGCGAIAVSLAAEARVGVTAIDVSAAALMLARENADRLAPGLVSFVLTDLLVGVSGPLHVVLANLPYVPSGRELPRDVADYEPSVAIFGGPRGTELIERFLPSAVGLLAPGGEIALELDEEEQAEPIAELARMLSPQAHVTIEQDGGGYDRVVHLRAP